MLVGPAARYGDMSSLRPSYVTAGFAAKRETTRAQHCLQTLPACVCEILKIAFEVLAFSRLVYRRKRHQQPTRFMHVF